MRAQLAEMRQKGVALLALCSWIVVLALVGMAIWSSRNAVPALILAGVLSVIPTYALIRGQHDGHMRMSIGVVAALQPSLLLYAAQGSVWQLDLHLYFFVGLALLIPLCDPRAIVAACLVAAVHHAMLGLVAPQWVFFGGTGLWRVLLHFGAVAGAGVILCAIASTMRDALNRVGELEDRADSLTQQVRESAEAIREARDQIRDERKRTAEAGAEFVAARKQDFEDMAAELDRSVEAVARSVAGTAQLLEQSARELEASSNEADDQVRRAVGCAETASKAANIVAAGVAELSLSIAEISIRADAQNDLTIHATRRAGGGGEAVETLTRQSQTIGEATRAIVRIAERTNLLSLNAAIEAASAGAAGRGFGIVAQEVKALAAQAAAAAVEIEAFLGGVRSGTLQAERSFHAIHETIGQLGKTATLIRYDVDAQRQSADTIESFARNAASETDATLARIRELAGRPNSTQRLSSELDQAAAILSESVRDLERSTGSFTSRLRAA